ncbi:Integrase [Novosphingobium sp. CF614]|uniref:tyrosine-type recombinase/integrase n=1 Tax=Novosphingobium sp. CF614 TaxID=1884364 RepID=UPI0008E5AD45|nr:site-specific integrase [Novosphingobium sp. CF614]SFF97032.1 Integrase [Novosphingobium sp. CF614]
MPVVAKELNPKALDAEIARATARMADVGQKHSARIPVGGRPPGLMLQITPAGSMSWIFRATIGGKRRELGLGPYDPEDRSRSVSLAQARKMAAEIRAGRDPVADRRGTEKPATFRDVAVTFLAAKRDAWKNAKHRKQWESTLATWVYPLIGDKPVATIDRNAVEGVLMQPVEKADGKPLWSARHETATRVRQRMEKVFGYAIARHHRADNPAAWRNCLEPILPEMSKEAKRATHHAALPYADAPAFMVALREREGTAAKALLFTILTAARSGEVRNAEWSEIDLARAVWTIPADRMKAGREHVVPLSNAAVAILLATPEDDRKGLIWSGSKSGVPMSDMTLAAVLKRMGRADLTVHGFRSTFRDWGGETTGHPREVIEHALAHQLADKAEAAYQRGSLMPKRVRLMADWAAYVSGDHGADVVPIRGAVA